MPRCLHLFQNVFKRAEPPHNSGPGRGREGGREGGKRAVSYELNVNSAAEVCSSENILEPVLQLLLP